MLYYASESQFKTILSFRQLGLVCKEKETGAETTTASIISPIWGGMEIHIE